MNKHAYLLMIHEQNKQLIDLLEVLDDNRNDIYIHVDKKCKNFNFNTCQQHIKFSNLYFTKRYKIVWAGHSIVDAEINLLKEAIKKKYIYFHLLSGSDLPIKSQDYIHNWFKEHMGMELVHFGTKEYQTNIKSRYSVYHMFQEKLGRYQSNRIYRKLDEYVLLIQKKLKIDRTKKNSINIYGGSNWFSITNELAEYVVSHINMYKGLFRFTQICDEMYLQTMVMDSHFRYKLYIGGCNDDYHQSMRYIDWARGKNGGPHTFTIEDYNSLIKSEYLFARKFNERIDSLIIDKICKQIKER